MLLTRFDLTPNSFMIRREDAEFLPAKKFVKEIFFVSIVFKVTSAELLLLPVMLELAIGNEESSGQSCLSTDKNRKLSLPPVLPFTRIRLKSISVLMGWIYIRFLCSSMLSRPDLSRSDICLTLGLLAPPWSISISKKGSFNEFNIGVKLFF